LVDALKAEMLAHRVLHADEAPVPMLDPGSGKTHCAYLWSCCTGQFESKKIVVYDFAESRAGKHAMGFLGEWRGALVCDDYSGYEALIAQGVTEAGCLAHARRKFYELWANHSSQIAEEALSHFGKLYDVEREGRDSCADERRAIRQARARPIAEALHTWLKLHRAEGADEGRRRPRRSTTASGGGRRSRATWMTACCQRTTTGRRTASGPLRSDATTGCSPAACARASGPRR
jgi:transposase